VLDLNSKDIIFEQVSLREHQILGQKAHRCASNSMDVKHSFLAGLLKLHNLLITTTVRPLSQPKRKPLRLHPWASCL